MCMEVKNTNLEYCKRRRLIIKQELSKQHSNRIAPARITAYTIKSHNWNTIPSMDNQRNQICLVQSDYHIYNLIMNE